MPTNFWTWFWPSFWMSGWNNQQMTTPTKQQKFPWLSDEQIKRLESLTSNPQEQQKLYQQAIQQLKQQTTTDNRIAAENEMSYRSMNEKNPQQANYLQSNVRLEQLADLTKWAFWLDAGADTQQVINWLMAMAQDNGVSLSLLNDYLDHWDEEFLYQMGLKQDPALQTNPDALSIKGSIANANGDKWEWNDNFFGRLETKWVEEWAWFWKNAGRFIGNVAKSGVNVLSDVWNMILNPLDTANALAKTAVWAGMNLLGTDDDIEYMQDWKLKDWYMSANETADTVWQFFKERYGGGEEILNTLFTDPVWVISDVASILEWGAGAVRGIAKWWAKWAAKAWLKWAARTLDNVAEWAGKVSRVAWTYDPYAVAMRAETQLPIKTISATVDVAKKIPWASAKMKNNLNVALDKAVWLDNNTRLAIQSNPFSKEVWQKAKTYIDANWLPEKSTEVSKQLITDVADRVQETMLKQMDEIWETWPMYQPLREAWYSVDLSAAKASLPEVLDKYGVTVWENGKLDFSKSSISSEVWDVQKIYNWINNTDGKIPLDEYLRLRKTGRDMVNFNPNNKNYIWKKIADTPWDQLIKDMIEWANKVAHEQVAPLKDLDAVYNKQMSLIQEVTDWIVYKDKSKAGAVRDNINQIIKNLDEPNRRVLKNRLEKVLPWIEEEVKAINMLPKLIDNYYRPSKAQKYVTWTAWSIIWTSIGWPVGWIIWAWVWYWLSGKIDKLKSAKWDKIISTTSKEWADKMADIQNRIANNQKITQAQKAFLNEISNKLKAWKQVKEWEIARIIWEVASAEDGDVLSVIDRSIQELKTIWAKEEIKELTEMRDNIQKAMNEEAEMNRYAEEFEAEKQNIINESSDQRLPEFKERIYKLQEEERRIWSVAWKKIWKNFEGKDYHRQQQTEWLRKKEAVIKEIQDYYNVDQFEASEIFDRIERQASADDVGFSKNQTSSKTAYQRYWTANPNEKGISATEWLNIRNFKNWKTVQELANQYWIDTKIVDSISTPEWQRAYWMYWDRLITLSKDLKESTVPHELLHGVFDIVDSKRRTSILEWIQKKLNVDNVQAEEWLADNFSEYYRTGKFWTQWLAKWLVEKVKQFFYQVKSYIDGTYKNEKQIRQLFDDIIDWKIEWEYGVYSDPKFQQARHGSPYEFEKFDSSHMGEWEWAQAHGWWHYVAVEERTWKHYAEIRPQEYSYKWVKSSDMAKKIIDSKFDWVDYLEWNANAILNKMQDGMNFEEAKKQTIENYKDLRDLYEENEQYEDLKKINKEIDFLKNIKESDIAKEKRNLYEVEIPDPIKKDTPTGKNYWEEDGALSERTINKFRKIFKEHWDELLEKFDDFGVQMLEYYGHNKQWYQMYRFLERALWSDKKASKFLEDLWYDGIHYRWARDWEAYVIFNDDALQITKHHKY